MTEYKKVAILGAGAVGAYVLWGLAEKPGIEVCLVAEGERKERLERDGLIINDKEYHPVVKTPVEAKGVDLVIVTVKYNALLSAVQDLKKMVDDHTVVISLMNGVDSEDTIAEAIGMEHVVHSLIKVASERVGNTIRFNPETTIGMIYGEMDLSRGTERVEALDRLFEGTGLHYRGTEYILNEIWSKFLLNVGNNLIQAAVGVGVGAYEDSEHMAFLKKKMREEVLAIAAAKGIQFELVNESSLVGSAVKPRARYSTLQDLDSKRHTEIDMFSGAIIKMGKELGIPTPFNEYTYHLIKSLEEKNDGLFDYE